jgi:hypothetical protein
MVVNTLRRQLDNYLAEDNMKIAWGKIIRPFAIGFNKAKGLFLLNKNVSFVVLGLITGLVIVGGYYYYQNRYLADYLPNSCEGCKKVTTYCISPSQMSDYCQGGAEACASPSTCAMYLSDAICSAAGLSNGSNISLDNLNSKLDAGTVNISSDPDFPDYYCAAVHEAAHLCKGDTGEGGNPIEKCSERDAEEAEMKWKISTGN